MGSIIWITLSILPSLIHTLSPLDEPLKASKYSFLVSPSTSYSYSAPSSSYVPAYPSFYEDESASLAQDSLSSSQLLPLPSIVSSSSIPFVFGRKSKDKKASIVRGKPVNGFNKPSSAVSASQSAETIDWSSDDMLQHPIDEAPRKVCIRIPVFPNCSPASRLPFS